MLEGTEINVALVEIQLKYPICVQANGAKADAFTSTTCFNQKGKERAKMPSRRYRDTRARTLERENISKRTLERRDIEAQDNSAHGQQSARTIERRDNRAQDKTAWTVVHKNIRALDNRIETLDQRSSYLNLIFGYEYLSNND
uniref:Uncharacterized protein n=1 Tax=Romanomermis culicivorax TaxID=13658 RepID=A0A915IL16_ROMCU